MNESGSKKRVGLFGGSFNPPHDSHFMIMLYAFHNLELDEVWMMVTPGSPVKDPADYAPLHRRVEWARMMAKDWPWLKVTDIEKTFPNHETANSLQLIKAMYPDNEFVWIMGADNMRDFHKWKRWQEIIDNHTIAVFARPEHAEAALKSEAAEYAKSLKFEKPEDLIGRRNGWCFIDIPGLKVAGTVIREQIRAGKRDIPGLRSDVEESIRQGGDYPPKEAAFSGARRSLNIFC